MAHDHKDWTTITTSKASKIFEKQRQKPAWIERIDMLLYWILLLIAILANFILSVALIPFLIVFQGWPLLFMIAVIGISFGWMFTFILHNLERLETHQHIIAGIFIPSIAIINVAMITYLSNKLILLLKVKTEPHSPILIGILYTFCYALPEIVQFHRREK